MDEVSICFIACISGAWRRLSFPDALVAGHEQLVAVEIPVARIIAAFGADGHFVRRQSARN